MREMASYASQVKELKETILNLYNTIVNLNWIQDNKSSEGDERV